MSGSNNNSESQGGANFKPTFPGQHASEKVELVFHQHPIVMRKALIYGMLVILAGTVPPLIWPLAGWSWKALLLAFVAALGYWFYIWIGWYYSVYVLTDQRIIEIKQRGFFNRRVSEFGLDKVQNINYHIRGLQAVIFHFGDITVQTYVGDLVMKTIHRPVQIHSQLIDTVRKVSPAAPPGV